MFMPQCSMLCDWLMCAEPSQAAQDLVGFPHPSYELPYDLRLVAGTIVKYLSEADCDVPPPDGGIAAPAPAGGQPSQRAPAG